MGQMFKATAQEDEEGEEAGRGRPTRLSNRARRIRVDNLRAEFEKDFGEYLETTP